jgi:hypothetical protein
MQCWRSLQINLWEVPPLELFNIEFKFLAFHEPFKNSRNKRLFSSHALEWVICSVTTHAAPTTFTNNSSTLHSEPAPSYWNGRKKRRKQKLRTVDWLIPSCCGTGRFVSVDTKAHNFDVWHSRCVLNHNVENECEKTVIDTTILGIFIASDGGYLATTTCFGPHGGHRQVVHTKFNIVISLRAIIHGDMMWHQIFFCIR